MGVSKAAQRAAARKGRGVGNGYGSGAGGGAAGRRSLGLIGAAASLAAVAMLSPVAAVVAMCGLLPTFAAILADWSENKAIAFAVGGMNLAGVFPFLLIVWLTGKIGSRAGVVEIVFPLTIMYGAAGCGWLLVRLLPRVVYGMHNAERDRKVAALLQIQEDLIATWGPQVAAAATRGPDGASMAKRPEE